MRMSIANLISGTIILCKKKRKNLVNLESFRTPYNSEV